MIIKEVESIEEANYCDQLLNKLINEEKEYNDNIVDNFVVSNWFSNIYLKNNKCLYIALIDNKIVGYIYVKVLELDSSNKNNKEAYIDGLYVLEEYRNKNVASSLIKKAKEWCVNEDIENISLNVFINNMVARNLYYKEGFYDYSVSLKCKL